MKGIELTKGYFAIVDDCEYEKLIKFRWHATSLPESQTQYAIRGTGGTRPRLIYMHREILKAKCGEIVDHKNGIGTDNRKDNLRIVTHSQNQMNRNPISKSCHTGHRGIYLQTDGKFRVQIRGGGKSLSKRFHTLLDAIAYARNTRKETFGEFSGDDTRLAPRHAYVI